MRSLLTSALLVLSCSYASAQTDDIETIENLNKEWLNAYITKDVSILNKIFSNDFELINPKGIKTTKADVSVNLGKQETRSVHIDSVAVRLVADNVGILTAYTTFVLVADGKEVTGRNCYQDVYVKKKNNWQAVSAHVTLLDMP